MQNCFQPIVYEQLEDKTYHSVDLKGFIEAKKTTKNAVLKIRMNKV